MAKSIEDDVDRILHSVRELHQRISGYTESAATIQTSLETERREREWYTKNMHANVDMVRSQATQVKQELDQLRAEFEAMKAGFRGR